MALSLAHKMMGVACSVQHLNPGLAIRNRFSIMSTHSVCNAPLGDTKDMTRDVIVQKVDRWTRCEPSCQGRWQSRSSQRRGWPRDSSIQTAWDCIAGVFMNKCAVSATTGRSRGTRRAVCYWSNVNNILFPHDRFSNITEWYIETGKKLIWDK